MILDLAYSRPVKQKYIMSKKRGSKKRENKKICVWLYIQNVQMVKYETDG